MKKALFISALATLLCSAAFIYSCQKETPSHFNAGVAGTPVAKDRSAACPSLGIINGVGMFICGTDSGTTGCTLCTEARSGETITSNPQIFGFNAAGEFSLTNTTGAGITVGVRFNCGLPPEYFNIPANSTVKFTAVSNGAGCCTAEVCTP